MDWKAIEADMAYIDRARYVGHLLSAQADRGQKTGWLDGAYGRAANPRSKRPAYREGYDEAYREAYQMFLKRGPVTPPSQFLALLNQAGRRNPNT